MQQARPTIHTWACTYKKTHHKPHLMLTVSVQWEKKDSKTKANKFIQKGMCERLAATCKALPQSKWIWKLQSQRMKPNSECLHKNSIRVVFSDVSEAVKDERGKICLVIHMHKSGQAQQSHAFVLEGSGNNLPVTVTSTDAELVPILLVASQTYVPAMSKVTGPLKISTLSRSSAELGREPFKLKRQKARQLMNRVYLDVNLLNVLTKHLCRIQRHVFTYYLHWNKEMGGLASARQVSWTFSLFKYQFPSKPSIITSGSSVEKEWKSALLYPITIL